MKLVWFRNDLRCRDNPALFNACRRADGGGVVAVVTLCTEQWSSHDESTARVEFWLACLRSLQTELAELNIPLRVIDAGSFDHVPEQLCSLARELQCDGLFLNQEYCLNEVIRDKQVVERFHAEGIEVFGFHGDVVFAPGTIMNGQGHPFRVFTPFSKAWRREFASQHPQPLPLPEVQPRMPLQPQRDVDQIPNSLGYAVGNTHWSQELWPSGTEVAHLRLQQFVADKAVDYGGQRDFPAHEGTSSLSPYLSCGVISARQCLAALEAEFALDSWLDNQWVTEIIWREFYRHLMVHFPEMNRWQPFKPDVESRIHWLQDESLFDAWSRGETGYPIVDAGMKQLLATGWMHNRVRMIVASFLTKLLRQDWRHGARFFMQNLVDGDFASNLGGWQWSASVGADAAPYFRIFSPMRQAERFDPQGEYVAQWLPELRVLNGLQRHDPERAASLGRPLPIIDYSRARAESLASYQRAT